MLYVLTSDTGFNILAKCIDLYVYIWNHLFIECVGSETPFQQYICSSEITVTYNRYPMPSSLAGHVFPRRLRLMRFNVYLGR